MLTYFFSDTKVFRINTFNDLQMPHHGLANFSILKKHSNFFHPKIIELACPAGFYSHLNTMAPAVVNVEDVPLLNPGGILEIHSLLFSKIFFSLFKSLDFLPARSYIQSLKNSVEVFLNSSAKNFKKLKHLHAPSFFEIYQKANFSVFFEIYSKLFKDIFLNVFIADELLIKNFFKSQKSLEFYEDYQSRMFKDP